jgi:hypothetical protein
MDVYLSQATGVSLVIQSSLSHQDTSGGATGAALQVKQLAGESQAWQREHDELPCLNPHSQDACLLDGGRLAVVKKAF